MPKAIPNSSFVFTQLCFLAATSNAEVSFTTSDWLTNSCHCVWLAHNHPGMQVEYQSSMWPLHNPTWCTSTRGSSRSLELPCALPCVCSPRGIHTMHLPPCPGRHLNQVQGLEFSYKINHEFPFFNISAEMHDHYQKHPEIHRIIWKLSWYIGQSI